MPQQVYDLGLVKIGHTDFADYRKKRMSPARRALALAGRAISNNARSATNIARK